MGDEEGNKLNRLETLKGKLFSKSFQTKIEHLDGFSSLHKREVMDSWKVKEKEEANNTEKFFMETSKFKKFFIFSIVFFALTLLYAGYVFFLGGNTVSNDNIDISILGNSFTAGGEELPLIIGITNKNNASLDLVDLVVEYPKGTASDLSSDSERQRISLGSIPAGAIRNENVKIVLFGEQGSVRPIKVSIEYRVAGSNAIFVKEKPYQVNISSTPINLSVDAPLTISPNQTVVLNVKTTLNATKPAPNILVKADYPVGFSFISSTPAPSSGNNVWDLGDIAPGAEHDITITGKMIDVFDGEQKTFNISTGSQSDSDKSMIGVVFNSIKSAIAIKKPFIEANIFVNGVSQREYAVDTKTQVNAEIHFVNNLDTKINDLQIEAKLSGNSINRNTINAQQGFYDSSKDVITWDKNSKDQLKEINPGDSGTVVFSFSPNPSFGGGGDILSSPTINIDVNISGKQSILGSGINQLNNSSSAIIRVISDIGFSAKGLYYSGSFTNTGPIPPKVEQSTTYTIVWTLSNTANSISNAKVSSTIPPWVTFVGAAAGGDNLSFNPSTKEIVWNVGRIQRGAGITAGPQSVSFQVSLKPSLSQVGTIPNLINDATLTGHDDFANVDVKVGKSFLNTKLDNDGAFPAGGGIVSQ